MLWFPDFFLPNSLFLQIFPVPFPPPNLGQDTVSSRPCIWTQVLVITNANCFFRAVDLFHSLHLTNCPPGVAGIISQAATHFSWLLVCALPILAMQLLSFCITLYTSASFAVLSCQLSCLFFMVYHHISSKKGNTVLGRGLKLKGFQVLYIFLF